MLLALNSVRRNSIKGYYLIAILMAILLCISPVMAYNGAKNVEIGKEKIHIGAAKCSCIHSDGYYYHHNIWWLNYCPMCHSYGTLKFEQGDYKGADYTSPEGLLYCTHCDADYCLVHGADHMNPPRAYLKRTTAPPVEKPKIEEPKVIKKVGPLGQLMIHVEGSNKVDIHTVFRKDVQTYKLTF